MVKEYLFCSKRLETNNKECNFRCFECRYFRSMSASQIRKKFNLVPEDLVIDNVLFGVTYVQKTEQYDHEANGE